MKVAIICGAGIVSGKEIMALELGKGLRDAGMEVGFITSRWGNGDFGQRTEASGFRTTRLWLGFISATLRLSPMWMTADQIRRWPVLLVGYRRFLRQNKPAGVIHTNWHHVLLLWPFLNPKRDIYWAHEVMTNTRQYRMLFQKLAKRVRCFVAVSRAAGDALVRLGVPKAMIHVIHNGIADPAANCNPGGDQSSLRIGIVGQVGAWKGHEDLLRAFSQVRTTVPTAELHVFGDGVPAYLDELRNLGAQLGIDSSTTWHGFISDRREIYKNLCIVTVPSRSEDTLPTVAIEAALFGLPVVATRRGGLPEIVTDGETGFLVEGANPNELAGRLKVLLQEPDLRRRMGQQARQLALERFGQERFLREFASLIRSTP